MNGPGAHRTEAVSFLQVAGLYKGTLWGIVGLVAGGQVGITSASRGACCLARCAPGLMVTAMIFPRLQVRCRH